MLDAQTIWDRFRGLPRAGRWAVAAALAVALFLLWDAGIRPLTESWNDRADQVLANAGEAGNSRRRLQQLRETKEPILALGAVERPGGESEGNRDLHAVVNNVLKRRKVSRDSFNYRGASKLPRGTLQKVIHPKKRLERITGDLRFDATPEEALAIIADLEGSPEIEAISSVRITRQAGPRKVTVDLTVEAWIESFERPSRRTGGA